MSIKSKIASLANKDLRGFKVVRMTEVYRVNDDGRKIVSLGFFLNANTAAAFAGLQVDANWHKTSPAFVLTDGNVGFVIERESVVLFDDEAEVLKLRKAASAKLSGPERKLLGLQ